MFKTLEGLQKDGYIVEARQLDSKRLDGNFSFPVSIATVKDREELKRRRVTKTPYTLINVIGGKMYAVNSYYSKNELLALISRK